MTDPWAVAAAVTTGVGYLLDHQDPDGAWTEWLLPPGSSPEWTTAFVALALSEVPPRTGPSFRRRLSAAAKWLLEHQRDDGGWGYNAAVETDADTTSTTILAIRAAGRDAPDTAFRRLALHQREDGGFATFIDGIPSSWTTSHPDVTPTCVCALLAGLANEDLVQRALRRVQRDRNPDGTWNSFWWDTHLYGTWVSMSLLRHAGLPVEAGERLWSERPSTALEIALLISCLCQAVPSERGRNAVKEWAAQLLSIQRDDGSWPSAPLLRITNMDCYDPWDRAEAGPLFADPNRLFTTAAALRALTNTTES